MRLEGEIDGGPVRGENVFNALYTSVVICVPGSTSQCQTIGGVLVDTGRPYVAF